jgi:GABA permease/aromatic amino acid permease
VPFVAVLVSTVVGFLAVVLNYTSPDRAFLFLVNSSGAVALFVWFVIAVSELRLRRRLEAESPELLTLRMWAYPYLTWLTLAGVGALLVAMVAYPETRPQLLLSLLVAAVVLAAAFVRERLRPAAAGAGRVDADLSRR